MDPMTMLMLAQAVMGGINGAQSAKKNGASPFGGFLQGALGGIKPGESPSGGAASAAPMIGGMGAPQQSVFRIDPMGGLS